jgi:hypothetical protein
VLYYVKHVTRKGALSMRWPHSILILAFVLLGFVVVSCAPSGPSTLEVIDSFETLANDKNLEGTMGLFAKNAIVEESFKQKTIDGTEEFESFWRGYYVGSPPCEFRDITVDGDNATFIWAELTPISEKLWPVVIEVKNGKITYMDFYEDATWVFIRDE